VVAISGRANGLLLVSFWVMSHKVVGLMGFCMILYGRRRDLWVLFPLSLLSYFLCTEFQGNEREKADGMVCLPGVL